LVLEDGRIVERGAHADLLAMDGRYAGMWALQQSVEDSVAPQSQAASVRCGSQLRSLCRHIRH